MQKEEIGAPSLQLDDQVPFKKEEDVTGMFACERGRTIANQGESGPGLVGADLVSDVEVPAAFVSGHAFEVAVQERADRLVGAIDANALAEYG
jgi:hypothetical protein